VPEDEIITEHVRNYPFGSVLGHVTGYLGEVDKNEVGRIDPECPEKGARSLGALVGRSGLEEEYECTLSGIDGEELVEVNSMGEKIRTLGTKEPIGGQDVRTSIHVGLQQKVAQAIEGKKGAVVVTDTKGGILALYSSPSFDPNSFLDEDRQEVVSLLENKDLPFFNRAIGGAFHPGSVFKPVVAIGALEEGEIDENYTYEDTGRITVETPFGNFTYNNWYYTQYGGTEGEIGLTRAIARSTDTFFYKTGELLGPNNIAKWASIFNLNNRTGVDLPGEVAGLIPTPEWKQNIKGERWFLGDTYNISIGQGDLSLTPISLNTMTSTIANDGRMCLPRLAEEPECGKLAISKENLELVQEGMFEACSDGGTGFTFFNFEPRVACKTGTAETFKENVTHAWFTVYAPVDLPEIVTTVLYEEGGEGSSDAGPIATEIMEFWFEEKRQ
jgi:penicillin-binding protein 2